MSQRPLELQPTTGTEKDPIALNVRRTLVLGSDSGRCDINWPGLAGAHCAIGRLKKGGWALRDLGSGHTTKLNNKQVQAARLAHGDLIQLGSAGFRVVDPNLDELQQPGSEPSPRARAQAPSTPSLARSKQTKSRSPQSPASDLDEIQLEQLPPAASSGPSKGQAVIDGFRLMRPLGRGSMGEVWLALQESLDRKVALKLLSPKLARDAVFVARFQSEARAAAALNHSNVVHVYDVGFASGKHYIAMEYMRGGNLEDRIQKEGALPAADVIAALLDAAAGLAFAEARGIVHRDIKPANLMCEVDGRVKIADLGLAMRSGDEGDGPTLGTPHFISPEQARGESTDSRSDLYSLGVTAWRMLTAATPFQGSNSREILNAVHSAPLPDLPSLAPDAPPYLVRVILRLMDRDPAQRFQSATDLSEALRAGLGADGAQAPKARNPLPLALGTFALLAAGTWAWFHFANQEQMNDSTQGAGMPSIPAPPAIDAPALNGPTDALGKTQSTLSTPDDQAPDEDERLKQFEASALVLWESAKELEAPERMQTLAELIRKYPGTSAASQAADVIAEYEVDRRMQSLQENAFDSQLSKALAGLRLRSGLEGLNPTLGEQPAALDEGSSAGTPAGTPGGTPGNAPGNAPDPAPLDQSTLESAQGKSGLGLIEQLPGLKQSLPPLPDFRTNEAKAPSSYSIGLAGLLLSPAPPGLESHPDWIQGRMALEQEFSDLIAQLQTEAIDRLQDWTRSGELESLARWLTQLRTQLNAPRLVQVVGAEIHPAGKAIKGLDRWAASSQASMDSFAIEFANRQKRQDAQDRAGQLQRNGSLAQQLRKLELVTAASRLEALGSKLRTEQERDPVLALAAEFRLGRGVLDQILTELSAGRWRRRGTLDPRGERLTTRQVLGAAAPNGLMIEGSDGKPELLEFETFSNQPAAFDALFRARLVRDFNSEELAGIAFLVRSAALLNALEQWLPALSDPSLLAVDAAEILARDAEHALDWARQADQVALCKRELGAAEALLATLESARDEKWSTATVRTENLLEDYAGTMLLLMLSDGSPWREAESR